ncbi:hypothetical protein [Microbacterium sp. ABRD28]|uniref:hypothetical protein n=1 Tax=Microbacterium sp. ABRD28 TaxID=2268461 RepID=UPI000F55948C|nr:hypothetical protein [Microbacterium sp. ABRD28]AZC13156.1 hypothetical protein DT073_05050 [Microbacterium sp. ABRD28]
MRASGQPNPPSPSGRTPARSNSGATTGSNEPNPFPPLRHVLSNPFVLTVTVLAVILTVVSTVFAAADADGDALIGNGMFAGPMLATFAVVTQVLWRRGGNVLDTLRRTMVYSPVVAFLTAAAGFVTTWVPSVAGAMASSRRPSGFHYWFEEPHPFVLPFLAGWFLGMLAGLVATLLVVLIFAYRRPRDFAAANMNDLSPKHAVRVRRANIALAWLLILVFLVPTLIVWGAEEARAGSILEAAQNTLLLFTDPGSYLADAAWIVGLALIPVGIGLTIFIVRTQRVDRAARRAAGVPVGLSAQDDDAERSA